MKRADEILDEAAATFRERNAIYKDNWKQRGEIMKILFPGALVVRTADEYSRLHMFEMIIMKITRLANAGLTHRDSIRDIAVYAALLEMLTPPGTKPVNHIPQEPK